MADNSAARRSVSMNHTADRNKPDRAADGNKSAVRVVEGNKPVERAAYGRILLRYGILPDASTLSAMRMNRIEALMRLSRRNTKQV